MLENLYLKFVRLFASSYIFLFVFLSFIGINCLYLNFGGWISTRTNQETLSSISNLLSAAATTFAAITAALLVFNWKAQHNLSLISKIITEIWDLHEQFSSEIYHLTYIHSVDSTESEYYKSYGLLIQYATPLRSKAQQLQTLLEGQIDKENWEKLQQYIDYLEMFYPWTALDFLEYRNDEIGFLNEFEYVHSNIMKVCKTYISLQ